MKIQINHRPQDELGFDYRLWLGNHYEDLTWEDLNKLKAAVDSALSPPKRGRGKKP